MKRLALVAVALLPACGGGGGASTPTTPSTPTPPPRASRSVLVVGASDNTFTVTSTTRVSGRTLKCGDAHVIWTITETAGLPAAVVSVDAHLREADGDIDGRRVTQLTTDNRVSNTAPFRFVTDRSTCGYEGFDLPMVMVVSVAARDDNGNTHTLPAEVGFTER